MITGDAQASQGGEPARQAAAAEPARDDAAMRLRALLVLAASAAAIWLLVNYAAPASAF